MDRYTEIRSFVLVAEKGSFASAALVEGVTPVVMGRRLDALEKRLGVKLMHRSTRGLALTDLGEQFLEQGRGLLREFDDVERAVSAGRNVVRGHLVVSAPAAFGRRHVAPHAAAFKALHPELKMSFNFTDSVVDLVREGKLFAVRVDGDLACNDGELLYGWVKQGLGVGWRSTWEIQAELKRGELVTVLDEFAVPSYDIQAVYPQQRYLPAKVRHFIDYLKAIYNREGYWEG